MTHAASVKRTMAVIKDVHCGVGDYGKAALWFTTYVSDCGAALQVLSWDEARTLLESAGVSDVYDLERRTCWVEEGNGLIKFIEMTKL